MINFGAPSSQYFKASTILTFVSIVLTYFATSPILSSKFLNIYEQMFEKFAIEKFKNTHVYGSL